MVTEEDAKKYLNELRTLLNKQYDLIYDSQIATDKSDLGTVGANLFQIEQIRKEIYELFKLENIVSEID